MTPEQRADFDRDLAGPQARSTRRSRLEAVQAFGGEIRGGR